MPSVTPQQSPETARAGRRIASNPSELRWGAAVLVLSLIALVPLFALGVMAFGPSANIWPHLLATVLPGALRDTLWLMLGVGLISLILGTGTAWLVTMCRFPGRGVLEWLLLVPLAVPTYISAYCWVEVMDYAGPVQSALRALFGWHDATQYWFPEIRSLPGAVAVMSSVLYPYVYLTARASFLAQSVCVLDVSRTLGHNAWSTFREVALPLARPALVAGVTLALMETINDIGAVEFFGVRTLTVTIYATWLGRGSLAGAAQLAAVLLVFVFFLIWLERYSRRRQRFHHTSSKYHPLPHTQLAGARALMATLACAVPVLLGFAVPAFVLAVYAAARLSDALGGGYLTLARNSLTLSLAAALLSVAAGIVLVYARRLTRSRLVHGLTRTAVIGYAVPGTVLAVGILVPLASLDNAVDAWTRSAFGVSTGLLLSGSAFAIVLAYTIRFLAVSHGAIEAGLGKVSPNLGMIARTLGRSPGRALREVHLPLIRPALVAAGLLVFVDSMKELPATILLRPFNFETLATHVYSFASLERFEDAALAALTIVAVGLVPVVLLNRAARLGFRSGPETRPGSETVAVA
ncbi:MAG: iron ABC transporter permease [Hyphomicrobiales bacterium]|nr:iron ABC transporter permease [Hyphomicrobiales bacterium]